MFVVINNLNPNRPADYNGKCFAALSSALRVKFPIQKAPSPIKPAYSIGGVSGQYRRKNHTTTRTSEDQTADRDTRMRTTRVQKGAGCTADQGPIRAGKANKQTDARRVCQKH